MSGPDPGIVVAVAILGQQLIQQLV